MNTLDNNNTQEEVPEINIADHSGKYAKWVWLTLVIISVLTFLVYFQAMSFDFLSTWDDNGYITSNESVQHLTWKNIKLFFTSFYVGNYQPFTMLLYALEYLIGGGDSFIFHIVNITFHILNTVLVFFFIKKLSSNNSLVAIVTAAFFAIHPMHVESVVWISERKDVLYAFFFFLSLLMYLNYLATSKMKFIIFAFVFFLSSCLSKSAAVVLPLLMFLIDYYKERKFNVNMIIEKIPFLITSLVFGIVAIYSQKSSIQEMAPSMSMIEHISIVCYSFCSYLWKAIVPVGLSAVYTYPIQLGSSLPILYYISIAATGILCILVWYSRKWGKDLIFGFLFFLITILLVLQIIPVGAAMMADRYTYIPYIGLFFILAKFIATNISQVKRFFQPISLCLIVALFAWFSWLTYDRVKVWEDEGKLFTDVIDKYPNSYISYQGRGYYYVQSVVNSSYNGSIENKVAFINKGIDDYYYALKYALKPDQKVSSYNNLGYAKYTIGDLEGAIHAFDNAIVNDTNCASAYLNRGFANAGLKRYEPALADLNKAISLNPKDSNAINNRDIIVSLLNNIPRK